MGGAEWGRYTIGYNAVWLFGKCDNYLQTHKLPHTPMVKLSSIPGPSGVWMWMDSSVPQPFDSNPVFWTQDNIAYTMAYGYGYPNFVHSNNSNVVYCDGHAAGLSNSDFTNKYIDTTSGSFKSFWKGGD